MTSMALREPPQLMPVGARQAVGAVRNRHAPAFTPHGENVRAIQMRPCPFTTCAPLQ